MSSNRIFFDGPASSFGGDGVFSSDGTSTPGGIGSSLGLFFFITNRLFDSGGGGGGAAAGCSIVSIGFAAPEIPFDGGIGMSVRSPFGAFGSLPSGASTLITFDDDSFKISLSIFSCLCFPFTSSANRDVSLMLIDFFGTTLASREGEGDFEGVRRFGGEGDR